MASCSFSPDGQFVLAGGWDGYLRLWEANAGTCVVGLKVAGKPVCSCAVTPNGKQWLCGTLDGMLARWDAQSHQRLSTFLAHPRPISDIVFSLDGRLLVTASWDRTLNVWNTEFETESRPLQGHTDIVAGCRITPDCKSVLSWSHDRTLRLWNLAGFRSQAKLEGHTDRVTAAAVSPDGHWAASGSRNGTLKLWDLPARRESASLELKKEIRVCFFLLDGAWLVTVDADGLFRLHALADLAVQEEIHTQLPTQCAVLSPTGAQVAVGCGDGTVRLLTVEGFDSAPLVITPPRASRRTQTTIQKLLGKSSLIYSYLCTCPVCRHHFEVPEADASVQASCPICRRQLRLNGLAPVAGER